MKKSTIKKNPSNRHRLIKHKIENRNTYTKSYQGNVALQWGHPINTIANAGLQRPHSINNIPNIALQWHRTINNHAAVGLQYHHLSVDATNVGLQPKCIAKCTINSQRRAAFSKPDWYCTAGKTENTIEETHRITNRVSSASPFTTRVSLHRRASTQLIVNKLPQIYTLNFNRQAFPNKNTKIFFNLILKQTVPIF